MAETTFKEAWGVLQRHAQSLRTQNEPNIDNLLGIVTESVAAYKVCQSRVEAVEEALEAALQGSGAGSAGATGSAVSGEGGRQERAPASSTEEDDPPF